MPRIDLICGVETQYTRSLWQRARNGRRRPQTLEDGVAASSTVRIVWGARQCRVLALRRRRTVAPRIECGDLRRIARRGEGGGGQMAVPAILLLTRAPAAVVRREEAPSGCAGACYLHSVHDETHSCLMR